LNIEAASPIRVKSMNEEDRKALVVRPSAAVEKIGAVAGDVLSSIIGALTSDRIRSPSRGQL